MPSYFDGTEVDAITMDGTALDNLIIDGTEVWAGSVISASDIDSYKIDGSNTFGDPVEYLNFNGTGRGLIFASLMGVMLETQIPLFNVYESYTHIEDSLKNSASNFAREKLIVTDSISDGDVRVSFSNNDDWDYTGMCYLYMPLPGGYSVFYTHSGISYQDIQPGDVVIRLFFTGYGYAFNLNSIRSADGTSIQYNILSSYTDTVSYGGVTTNFRLEVAAGEATQSETNVLVGGYGYSNDFAREFIVILRP